MLGWSAELTEYQRSIRRFVEKEVAPLRRELELGGLPPYDLLRKYYAAFGIGETALERYEASITGSDEPPRSAAETIIPMVEFSRHSPGMMTALGVSVALAAGTILRRGTREQKDRWARDLLTLRSIGAWAITEPDSGSDAIGGMRATAVPSGDGWVVNGAKTFITNAPHADTVVFICKLDDGTTARKRRIMTFVLERGMPGLFLSEALPKMGLRSSPTGEVVATDVRVGRDRLLEGGVRPPSDSRGSKGTKAAFATERASVAAFALGIIERCLELSVEYADTRVQFGRPIGDFQLIKLKLARMEIARLNVSNLLYRYVEMVDHGHRPLLAEASAMKLYCAQAAIEVAGEAVQVFGGSGYMAESPVEQLFRDARVLQIYGGTDEIQVTHVADGLLKHHRASRG